MGTIPDPTERAAKKPLLDLDTLVVRPTVRIDGVEYEMVAPDELSILEYHRLINLGKRLDAIEQVEEPTEAQEIEYEDLLDTLCRRILLAPDEVHKRLKRPQRAAVALTFTQLRLMASFRTVGALVEASQAETATADASDNRTTGASLSPALYGGLVAARKAGSKKRRARSSGRTSR